MGHPHRKGRMGQSWHWVDCRIIHILYYAETDVLIVHEQHSQHLHHCYTELLWGKTISQPIGCGRQEHACKSCIQPKFQPNLPPNIVDNHCGKLKSPHSSRPWPACAETLTLLKTKAYQMTYVVTQADDLCKEWVRRAPPSNITR